MLRTLWARAGFLAVVLLLAACSTPDIAYHSGAPVPEPRPTGDVYDPVEENQFREAAKHATSTFSVDVDTASYTNMRRFLSDGTLPPRDAIRVEEFLNYFVYEYPAPQAGDAFSITTELGSSPWNDDHYLLHLGIQGKQEARTRPFNLVFLLDVSGSMGDADKLPLLKDALKMLVKRLTPDDRVAIVVYAGASGVVLSPTSDRDDILEAIERLEAGGSTNGGEGIQLAYELARENYLDDGINRVILATDGDFNVGVTGEELLRLVEEQRKSGVFLTVLGFGRGNLKDSQMEQLADKGNGNYAYIDGLSEARRVLVEQVGGTLVTIAKDVKIQVDFNPELVQSYRLIGYENRILEDDDFQDDSKDAGEIGMGHSVTALYEIVPTGQSAPGDRLTVNVRYKEPDGDKSRLVSRSVLLEDMVASDETTRDFRFSAAVASFGLLLHHSENPGLPSFESVLDLAQSSTGQDVDGRRAEFLELVRKADELSG